MTEVLLKVAKSNPSVCKAFITNDRAGVVGESLPIYLHLDVMTPELMLNVLPEGRLHYADGSGRKVGTVVYRLARARLLEALNTHLSL